MTRRSNGPRSRLIADLDRENRRAGSLGGMHAKAIADRAGINGTDFECLDVLDWTGPIPAGELARRLGITSGAVTGVIDRLERGGWVHRLADPSDRRRVIVEIVPPSELTGDRDRQMVEMFAPLQQEIGEVIDRFDDDQLTTIVEYMRAANEAVERSIARLRES
jgi:DNA-binding MarR family transcriptional regulator